ncbi:probable O-methyltransferase 3 [Impatiens glandulifera]|uniref:probable O-methyltransferase 3 n=1 Tax=Impatiens glandulifera TaxID=253017 RepID=UPI001FB16475|nr:probable O-methyltransferase 3 [Impatiens glandulifera]
MDSNGELARAHADLWKHLFGFLPSAALNCLIELGVPDLIQNHGKPMTVSEIVGELSITNPIKTCCLGSMMDILAHSGFLSREAKGVEDEDIAYSLTTASRLLLKDEPLNLRQFVFYLLGKILAGPWPLLGQWLKNDTPTVFETCYGIPFWELATKSDFGPLFNEAMAVDSRLIGEILVNECKAAFEGLASIVDVAGGTGTLATIIAKNFPTIKCKVFDLPHVVAGLQNNKNLEFIGGDMFEEIPHVHVALLKNILHDWSDEKCIMILKKCKEAISEGEEKSGKVMVIEMVKREDDTVDYQLVRVRLAMDVHMTSCVNGMERNEKEWAHLFFAAGFTTYKITPMSGLISLIELFP